MEAGLSSRPCPAGHCGSLSMKMTILFLCRHSAADMPLGLVKIQHLSRLCRQRRINMDKAIRHILMYGTLAHPKFPGSLPHRCFLLNNIPCYFHRTFLDIILQGLPPAMLVFTVYAKEVRGIQKRSAAFISASPHIVSSIFPGKCCLFWSIMVAFHRFYGLLVSFTLFL